MLKYGDEAAEQHKTDHREHIKSATGLQQKTLQADRRVSNEDIEFLERW